MIYLDNAATSFPKPACVAETVARFIAETGASPGRSGHSLSVEAGRIVYETRERAAGFFGVSDPLRVVFTSNATHSINTVLYGLLKTGDAVAVSESEHNSVARPLVYLEESRGIKIIKIKTDDTGVMDPEDLKKKVSGAKLVCAAHGNNVTGAVSDLKELALIAKGLGALFMADAAQTAGVVDINAERTGIDYLCVSGHKSLYGPQGTGMLIFGSPESAALAQPFLRGGTGSSSEKETHPASLPDKFEAGTQNGCGIAGLNASLAWLEKTGVKNIAAKEKELTARLLKGLSKVSGLKILSATAARPSVSIVSFVAEGFDVSRIAEILDEKYGILCRPGLQCAPSTHKRIGTFPSGVLRLSPGFFNTEREIDLTVAAIGEITK